MAWEQGPGANRPLNPSQDSLGGLQLGALSLQLIRGGTTLALKCPVWSLSPGGCESTLLTPESLQQLRFQPPKPKLQQNQTELNSSPSPQSVIQRRRWQNAEKGRQKLPQTSGYPGGGVGPAQPRMGSSKVSLWC
jgi:hypothetical protein